MEPRPSNEKQSLIFTACRLAEQRRSWVLKLNYAEAAAPRIFAVG